jgi:phage antirepressor YoqD-like protein
MNLKQMLLKERKQIKLEWNIPMDWVCVMERQYIKVKWNVIHKDHGKLRITLKEDVRVAV